jgi:hypothetical protein
MVTKEPDMNIDELLAKAKKPSGDAMVLIRFIGGRSKQH